MINRSWFLGTAEFRVYKFRNKGLFLLKFSRETVVSLFCFLDKARIKWEENEYRLAYKVPEQKTVFSIHEHVYKL